MLLSQYLIALGWKVLLVNIVQQGKIAAIDIHCMKDLSDCWWDMLLGWSFHFQLFSLDCVAVIQMGWVYTGDEHLVIHVIFILQLQLDKFHFFLQSFVFLLFSKVFFFPDQDLFNIFHFALTILYAGSDFIDVTFV